MPSPCLPPSKRGYTLVELIIIILMIAVGTTLILAIHTRLQRSATDTRDDARFREFADKLRAYHQKYNLYPSVEPFLTDADRKQRFEDFRQKPGRALRILLHDGNSNNERQDLKLLYSPLDGDLPENLISEMMDNKLSDTRRVCFSSYSYDPGHQQTADGHAIIFGHSPAFLARHSRSTLRYLDAQLNVSTMEPDSTTQLYQNPYHLPGQTQPPDLAFEDQSGTLFNADSYLNDLIPFSD